HSVEPPGVGPRPPIARRSGARAMSADRQAAADRAVPWRVFLGVGVFIAVLAIVYWFVSYEDAGTTMLVLASCLALFCGVWFYLQDGQRPRAPAGDAAESRHDAP